MTPVMGTREKSESSAFYRRRRDCDVRERSSKVHKPGSIEFRLSPVPTTTKNVSLGHRSDVRHVVARLFDVDLWRVLARPLVDPLENLLVPADATLKHNISTRVNEKEGGDGTNLCGSRIQWFSEPK